MFLWRPLLKCKRESLPMHPPQFYQRSLILPIVNLQVDAVCAVHNCSHRAVNNEASVQRYGYWVTDLELGLVV